MSEEIAVVNRADIAERPANKKPWTDAVLKTVGTDEAIRITLNGTPAHRVVNSLHAAAKLHGMRVHTRVVNGMVYAWAEPRK